MSAVQVDEKRCKVLDKFIVFYSRWNPVVNSFDSLRRVAIDEFWILPETVKINFLDALVTFIEREVRNRIGTDIHVYWESSGDEIRILAKLPVKLDKMRDVIIVDDTLGDSVKIADSLEDLDDMLSSAIDSITEEARSVLKYLESLRR